MKRLWFAGLLAFVLAGASLFSTSFAAGPLSISGVVWQDVNGDGVRQPGDVGLQGQQVKLLKSGGATLEAETDASGTYRFTGLEPGSYLVQLSFFGQTPNFFVTYPEADNVPPLQLPVTLSDTSVDALNFGLYGGGIASSLPMFNGLAWIDAAPADFPAVRAFVDGVDCTGPGGVLPTDLDSATYQVGVLSAQQLSGCGEPGKTISFTVKGFQANETAEWQPVLAGHAPIEDGRGHLDLTVGPPFAYFYPRIVVRDAGVEVFPPYYIPVVVALIDGNVCGISVPRGQGGVLLIVPSQVSMAGCGHEGAAISFAVDGFAVAASAAWHTGQQPEIKIDFNIAPASPLAGPEFAYYSFDIPAHAPDYVGQDSQGVQALIGGKPCGGAGGVGPVAVVVAVAPAEVAPGCGEDGAQVSFTLNGKVVGAATWQAGFHEGPALSAAAPTTPTPVATASPASDSVITPPDTGDAGLAAR